MSTFKEIIYFILGAILFGFIFMILPLKIGEFAFEQIPYFFTIIRSIVLALGALYLISISYNKGISRFDKELKWKSIVIVLLVTSTISFIITILANVCDSEEGFCTYLSTDEKISLFIWVLLIINIPYFYGIKRKRI